MGLLDFLFPKMCLGCGEWGKYLCPDCMNLLSIVKHQKCPMCEKRSITGEVHSRCKTPLGMNGVVAGLLNKGIMRRIIGKYKFSYAYDLLPTLVELLTSFGDVERVVVKTDLVLPIPLHTSRLKERGFNQADLLGKKLAEYFDKEYLGDVLVRNRKTKIQSLLKREERVRNLKGAFQIQSKNKEEKIKIKNKNILLIDDVWTTGSTMRECTKVLKRNGANEVWGLVLARG